MKSVILSKDSRWFRTLDAMGISLRKTTFCDVARELLAMLGSAVLCLTVIFAALWPFGDLLAWGLFMVLHGFEWIAPNGAAVLVTTGYAVVGLAFLGYRYLPMVLDGTRFSSWLLHEVEFDTSTRLFRTLNWMGIAYWHSEYNSRFDMLKRSIGWIFGALLLIAMFVVIILLPIIGIIAFVYTWISTGHVPPFDSALFKSTVCLVGMWLVLGFLAIMDYLRALRRRNKRALQSQNILEKESFAGNLWRSFKDKTCVKIEVMD